MPIFIHEGFARLIESRENENPIIMKDQHSVVKPSEKMCSMVMAVRSKVSSGCNLPNRDRSWIRPWHAVVPVSIQRPVSRCQPSGVLRREQEPQEAL